MENLRSSYIPFAELIREHRETVGLDRLNRPFSKGCESAYIEALRAVKEHRLPGIGPEAYMYGLIREWTGVEFIYDVEPESHYPDRVAIEEAARETLLRYRPEIYVNWQEERLETECDNPGLSRLATLAGAADKNAGENNFPEIVPANFFHIIFINESTARHIALVNGIKYRTVIRTLTGRGE